MSRLGEALFNIGIAWRLALFDGRAAKAFPDSDRSVWRSFWMLPAVLLLDRITGLLTASAFAAEDGSFGRSSFATGWLVVGWLLALVVSGEFARHMDRLDRWPRYVVAHNSAALIQASVFTAGIAVLNLAGASSDVYGLWVVGIGFWSLVYDWFVVRTVLEVPRPHAALLMAVLLLAALVVNQFASGFVTN